MTAAKTPHPCAGCGEVVTGRKYHNAVCRRRANNQKRYRSIRPTADQLPLIPPATHDARTWRERRKAIVAKRDGETKRYEA